MTITLQAGSISGLSAVSPEQSVILPERSFNNPVARTLIALRKRLIFDPVQERIPAAGKIARLAEFPELFGDDSAVYLSLRVGAKRLYKSRDLAELPTVENMLWQAAIRIDGGRNGEARQNVADAAAALKQALASGAPQAEIDRLSKALKNAMNKYLSQMERQMAERLARGESMPSGRSGPTEDRKSLNDMVDKLDKESREGNRGSAQDLLSQLDDIMRNLRMAQGGKGSGKGGKSDTVMSQLHKMIDRQQQMADDSFHKSQQNSGTPQEGEQGLRRRGRPRPPEPGPGIRTTARPGARPGAIRRAGSGTAARGIEIAGAADGKIRHQGS